MTKSTKEATTSVRAIAWDPTNPGTLWMPRIDKKSSDNNESTIVLDGAGLLGAGCNSHELVALTKLIQAREEYFYAQEAADGDESGSGAIDTIKALSRAYRQAIQDCIQDWREDDELQDGDDGDNQKLLNSMYTCMHLSDVFLPLLVDTDTSWSSGFGGGHDRFNAPGAATADMVRFIRHNLLSPIEAIEPAAAEMVGSMHPEQFGDGTLYWDVITKLVLRGYLDEAWDVLSRHSLYVQAQRSLAEDPDAENAENQYMHTTFKEIEQDFLSLCDLLKRAPLPGGRNNESDDGLSSPMDMDDDMEDDGLFLRDLDVYPSDYKFWESESVTSKLSDDVVAAETHAQSKHAMFQSYVTEFQRSFSLLRRMPELNAILAILHGDFADVQFDSWAEMLCAELIYQRPELRPSDMSARANALINKFDDENPLWDTLLSVMEGNAGRAVELMWVQGGSTLAALPSMITSIFFSLLVEADILTETVASHEAEYLRLSAEAIWTSVQDSDVGASLSIRLLVPYAIRAGDRSLLGTIAEILQRHSPGTDPEARGLLSICRPLVQMKSAHVLDGCVAVVMQRYRHYAEASQFKDATGWLLSGMELEKLVYASASSGVCYRTLEMDCLETSVKLLQRWVKQEELDPMAPSKAAALSDVLKGNDLAIDMRAAQVLIAVASIGRNSEKEAAQQILSILGDKWDNRLGFRSSPAMSSLCWYLLKAAKVVIMSEADGVASDSVLSRRSLFDKDGVTLLMERWALIVDKGREWDSRSRLRLDDEGRDMNKVLMESLAGAIFSENAQLNDRNASLVATSDSRMNKIHDVKVGDFDEYTVKEQEEVVKQMLNNLS